jgi:hypothetical protein
MKKTLKLSSLIIMLGSMVGLTGCAGMNGRFGCDSTAGRSCLPVSQVNARASAGYFNYEESSGHKRSWATSNSIGGAVDTPSLYISRPIRTSEHIQRIWIAPYQDLSNNYHGPSTIYAVFEKPHWVGQPARETKATETQQDD